MLRLLETGRRWRPKRRVREPHGSLTPVYSRTRGFFRGCGRSGRGVMAKAGREGRRAEAVTPVHAPGGRSLQGLVAPNQIGGLVSRLPAQYRP